MTMTKLYTLALLLIFPTLVFAGSSDEGGLSSDMLGQPNGIATLDGTGKVPAAQLPGGGGGGSVTNVSGTAPLVVVNPTTTPNISMPASTNAVNGYLTAADHTTFAAKESALTFSAPLSRAVNTVSCVAATGVVAGCLQPADFLVFNAKEPAIAAGLASQYWRGDKTFQTLDTLAVTENTNLYFTEARVRATPLTGFVSGAGTVAATDNVLQAIQKLDGNAIAGLAAKWDVAGNAGTSGTAVVGTTDAQPWSTTANGIFIDNYAIDGQVSSIMNVLQPDSTSFYQKRNQVNLSLSASSTATNFLNQNNSISLAGAFDYAGSVSGVGSSIDIGSSGTTNFASNTENSLFLHGGGTINLIKGVNQNTGVTSATVNSLNNFGSYLNATDWTGSGRGFEGGFGIDDSTLGSFDFIGGNANVTGTSTMTGNLSGIAIGVGVFDTVSANQVLGTNITANVENDATASAAAALQHSVTIKNNAAISGGIFGQNNGVNVNDAATVNGLTGVQTNVQANGTGDLGPVQVMNHGITLSSSVGADSITEDNGNLVISGSNVVQNVNGRAGNINISGTAAIDNITGTGDSITLGGNATAINFQGFNHNLTVDGSAVLTNGLTGGGINLSTTGGATVSGATGLSINMNNVNLSPAALAAGTQKQGLTINDGSLSANYAYTIPGAAAFFQQHYIGGGAIVASGDPTAAFGFGTNLAQSVQLHDDWTIDASGLGYVDVGFVGSLEFDAGTTMARWTGALGGAGNSGGAGTLTDAIMFRAAGILPQGGALTVTNAYGFQVDPVLACITGTNCWGFYEDTAVAQNHMSKLAIGTSTKKVANSDTALEIGNSKALLNGRGTTAVKNALTPLAGMQFYDTDLSKLQWYNGATWIDAAASTALATVADGGDAAYTILAGDTFVRSGTALTANRTYTLPACAGGNIGEVHDVKNVAGQGFDIILDGNGGDTIDGSATITLNPGDSYGVFCAAAGAWDVK